MAKKRKRRIRWDRVAGTLLVLAALVTSIVLLARGCHRDSTIADVTELMKKPEKPELPEPTVNPGKSENADTPGTADSPRAGRLRIISHGPLREVFNDSNHRQLEHAERLGIAPLETLGDAYFTRRPIVEVRSNRYYTVDTLTHSVPFLVPEAERLLNDIGRGFMDSLKARGVKGDSYRIITTSLLRTPRHVRKLRRVNVNATEASTHQFGTTFDISYRRFDCLDSTKYVCEEDLKNLLGEVLYDLRAKGRCMVKYERKTPCFHVTAIK